MLAALSPERSLLDVRHRATGGPLSRLFLRFDDPDAARTIVALGQRADVYVGCAPRLRRRGRREDVAPTALLWADCDGPQAFQALLLFEPAASVIVASGSDYGAHAYWALTRPLDVEELEEANRRLAIAMGADLRCTDAARVLRVPGTQNFKHVVPRPVELLRCTSVRYAPAEIIDQLPASGSSRASGPRSFTARSGQACDPLLQIAPREYIRVPTGLTPSRDGKVRCPFHYDRTPSLHVYATPEEGWACFGCEAGGGRAVGGDIYTFAGRLWGIPTRGCEFVVLRRRLDVLFGVVRDRSISAA